MVERNPAYDGVNVFVVRQDALQPGDVFLTKNVNTTSKKGRLQSGTIATATRGAFSHALICTVPPNLLEAIGDGVSNISTQICFAHDLKFVKVLRYHNPQIARAAGSIALSMLGQHYGTRLAIASVLPSIKAPNRIRKETFCSALVASVYRSVGAPEFAGIDPFKTTPAVLEKAPYFTDVTTKVLREMLAPNNVEEMSALDGDRAKSPLAGQARLFQSFVAEVSPELDKLFSEFPDFSEKRPITFFQCLDFVVTGIRSAKKLPNGNIKGAVLQRLGAIDELMQARLAKGELEELYKLGVNRDLQSHQYMIGESFKAKPDIDVQSLIAFLETTRSQIESRSRIFKDPDYALGLSRAFDEWRRISEDVIETFRQRELLIIEVINRLRAK